MPPKSLLGSRTLVPTVTLAGLSLCSHRLVNYFDTAVQYGSGESEKNLGRVSEQ
jgi:hypothetical protein